MYKLATIMYNPDSSNKVDSVDYKPGGGLQYGKDGGARGKFWI